MEMIDHPFIMKYYGSLRDQCNIYFILENVNGIELFEALKIRGKYFFFAIKMISFAYYSNKRSDKT
jgi:hypothetical protein